MPPHSRGRQAENIDHPGAGTLFVHGNPRASSSKRNSLTGSRSRSRTPVRLRPSSGSRERSKVIKSAVWPPEWQELSYAKDEAVSLLPSAADALLERGVGDYTFLPAPEGLLGRGKFSTVYKVLGLDGKPYALKHTPLHPHHPLIAARLLREPTLLAQLPAHPCLVGVEGWIRTEGHFYLIEQYAATHIPLHLHPLPLRPSRAAYILDQLVSVIRDCMHRGRVCHRDLKGENVMVDIETGDIVVLDLGLATQFSASEPKLTTCCGSPAFHSPEIVNALNHPPGAVTYYGPEIDIWCIALTLLSLLSSSRFPLGPTHRSRHTMASRVLDRLQELDITYPPHRPAVNWALSSSEHELEVKEWARVRKGLTVFLEMDGKKRMEGFNRYTFGQKWKERLDIWEVARTQQLNKEVIVEGEKEKENVLGPSNGGFKQLSFLPTEVKYTLPLTILPHGGMDHHSGYTGTTPDLILANPTHESDRRVLSYIKYLLRIRGILYHSITPISTQPSNPLFQLIIPLPSTPEPNFNPNHEEEKSATPWLSALFRRSRSSANNARSASLPPKPQYQQPPPPTASSAQRSKEPISYLRCYIQLEFTHPVHSSTKSGSTRAQSSSATPRSGQPGARRRSTSTTATSTRSTSLASTFLSRVEVRDGTISPMAVPLTAGMGEGEGSLAVASLQQALLKITELSPTPSSYSRGVPVWSSPTSPIIENGSFESEGSGSSPNIETTERSTDDSHTDGSTSTPSGDSGNTSPVISTPTTPRSLTPMPLPLTKLENATTTTQIKPVRPNFKRAASTPRPVSTGSYRGLPPVSPSLALTPLPVHTLSPLSRQVSLTDISESRRTSTDSGRTSQSPSGITTTSASASTSSGQPSGRRTASRPTSRLHSRATSRAPSVSTIHSSNYTPTTSTSTNRRTPPSRANSTISSSAEGTDPSSISDSASRPISYVFIRISDPRGLEPLREALDVPNTRPIAVSPRGGRIHLVRGESIAEAKMVGIPNKNKRDEAQEVEEEEERGRPRSREDPRILGMSLTSNGSGSGSGSGGSRKGINTAPKVSSNEGVNDKEKKSSKIPGEEMKVKTREISSTRKMFGLFGLGAGLGLGQPESVLVDNSCVNTGGGGGGSSRRGSTRNSSAPPI